MIHFLVIAVAISGVMDTESAIDTKNAVAISGVMKMAIESASKPASATVAAATATTIPTGFVIKNDHPAQHMNKMIYDPPHPQFQC